MASCPMVHTDAGSADVPCRHAAQVFLRNLIITRQSGELVVNKRRTGAPNSSYSLKNWEGTDIIIDLIMHLKQESTHLPNTHTHKTQQLQLLKYTPFSLCGMPALIQELLRT